MRDGLIPNVFPEGETEGLYHTADATLWFFEALHRYLAATGDHATLAGLLPTLVDIVEHHVRGTRFGIGVDPADGLLRQGAPGLPAHLDGRQGRRLGRDAAPGQGRRDQRALVSTPCACSRSGWRPSAARWRPSRSASTPRGRPRAFNTRFWYAPGGYLYDVVDGEDGDDPACRPNQMLAPWRSRTRCSTKRGGPRCWTSCAQRLLTPLGLRSLDPEHQDYKSRYDGDLRARDAAYHQGTVWAWLIGPFVDAWLRVYPGRPGARPPVARRVRSPPERRLHRLDQRDLRRRGAVHAARVRGPGLERGRGAARLDPDRALQRPALSALSAAATRSPTR